MSIVTQERPSPLAYFEDMHPPADDFLQDALDGLSKEPKQIAPKYFYDQKGSELFEAICETEEYYVTRTEIALLNDIMPELRELAGANATILEFGSGASVKIRSLLDGFDTVGAYIAIDISRDHLINACRSLANDYPDIAVGAICADFTAPMKVPSLSRQSGRVIGFLPGSTIGNFTPEEASIFLAKAARLLGKGSALLMGVDLKKDPAKLRAAYNDQAGVTAAFNLNLLARMKKELGADLDPDNFSHHAFYNESQGRVEMHLKAEETQTMELEGETFTFSAGETIHTENSYKYRIDEFRELAENSGFRSLKAWSDPDDLFSLHWLEVHTS